MVSGYWIFFEIFLCLVEVVLLRMFVLRFGKERDLKVEQKGLLIIAAVLLIYFKGKIQVSSLISMAIAFIIQIAFVACICEMKYYQYIVFTGLYLLMILSSEVGIVAIMQLILPMDVINTFMQSRSSRFICAVISKLFLLVIIRLIVKRRNDKNEVLAKESVILLCCSIFISYLCLYSIVRFGEINRFRMSNKEDFYACLLSIGIFAIDCLVYMIIGQLNHRINREKKLEMVQYQNELLEKMVLENKEVEKEWRKNRHDFNNHLSCVDMLLQMENIPKARAYIQNLTQNYLGSTPIIKVGNEIADAVINQKYLLASKKHIAMKVEGSLEENVPIEQMDLCALLSNSLDNAIEASEKVPEEEKRSIQLNFRVYRSYLIIEVINAVKENINSQKEKLETTKKDQKHHGIGMTSMQTTVEKYKGHMEWKCKDCSFSLVVLLPIVNG